MNTKKIIDLLKSIIASFKKKQKKPSLPNEDKVKTPLKSEAQKLYVNAESGLNVRKTPTIGDNRITLLKHGQEVLVLEKNEGWFKVQYNIDKEGWVSSLYLRKNKATKEKVDDEFPDFKVNEVNRARDPNTLKLRKYIERQFGLDFDKTCLQCTEYTHYRVKQKLGITIEWPFDRPRHGKFWGEIFRKNKLYKVLENPKANCAVSFTTGFNSPKVEITGHVAFVEEVLDNDLIKISEANYPSNGTYNERFVPKIEWKDKYKCEFIDFSEE